MANETIELLKPYEPKRLCFPSMHQQKIDGVPVIVKKIDDKVTAYSRQGEKITSVPHIEQFCSALLKNGEGIVMELHKEGLPFKEISGLVRKKVPTAASRELIGWAFDFIPVWPQNATWIKRRELLAIALLSLAKTAEASPSTFCVRILPGTVVNSEAEADEAHEALMLAKPDAEGSVYHWYDKEFSPGKRLWYTQKRKPIPTIDLRIVGFEEAISKDGVPLGMVGRVNAEFATIRRTPSEPHCTIIGIGPGALNHTERKELWRQFKAGKFTPRIAEIQYMRDDSYDALRQPTFVCWRDDKQTPDFA